MTARMKELLDRHKVSIDTKEFELVSRYNTALARIELCETTGTMKELLQAHNDLHEARIQLVKFNPDKYTSAVFAKGEIECNIEEAFL